MYSITKLEVLLKGDISKKLIDLTNSPIHH